MSVKAAPVGLVARSKAASVALGKSVFIWGGQDGSGKALDDGAIYSPAKDSWTYLSKDAGAPTARIMATALWTGSVVIVFGGTDATGNTVYRDGSIYDPVANSWSALPASGAISRRSAPFAFWDGTRALFWGGLGATGFGVPNADRFDLTSWSTSTNSGDPGALSFPAVAFDGSVVYLMGGQLNGNRQDKVFAYSTSTDSWTNLTKSLLTARSSAFGAWDGSHFVVWGGRDDANGLRNDGKYLSGTTWTSLNTAVGSGVPSPRLLAFRRSGWSFQTSPGAFAVMGGQVSVTAAATLSTNGGSYNVALQQWSSIPDWPSADVHEYGMGVWTGEEFVVWGGRDATGVTSTGDRWAP